MITKEQAMGLTYRQTIYGIGRNADGTVLRFRVNGAIKTWKRAPNDFRVPLKYGLYDYLYLDDGNCHTFFLSEAEAENALKSRNSGTV